MSNIEDSPGIILFYQNYPNPDSEPRKRLEESVQHLGLFLFQQYGQDEMEALELRSAHPGAEPLAALKK